MGFTRSQYADFANLLKSFVGTQYMTLSYGFLEGGIVLGFVIIGAVATLTTHCCELIVKCKYYVIEDNINRIERLNSAASNGKDRVDIQSVSDAMKQRITIIDIAHNTYGRVGSVLVTLCLLVTQCGFCVAYHIFIGNVLWAMAFDPFKSLKNSTLEDINGLTDVISLLNSSLHLTENHNSTFDYNYLDSTSYAQKKLTPEIDKDINSTLLASCFMGIPVKYWLPIFVVSPLPLFMAFTLFRRIRGIGSVSMVANFAVAMCFILILVYLGIDFNVADGITYFNWGSSLVMVGQAVASYEAVGTLLFIEGSMEENRHHFVLYLRLAIFSFTALFTPLALLGYLKYGENTAQILLLDLPQDPLVIAAEATTILGVVLTYPIQIYPVTEMLEKFVFGTDMRPDSLEPDILSGRDAKPLLEDILAELGIVVVTVVPKTTPIWKRNSLRICIALFIAGMALLFENAFAYASALVGALGSTPLAFIFPCLFQLKLRYSSLSRGTIFKDICIIGICVIFCVGILVVAIVQIVEMDS